MKIVPISWMLMPAFAKRRATTSPASMTYSAPFTISRFEDCARRALEAGPAIEPSVIRRVPRFEAAADPPVCAEAEPAHTAATTQRINDNDLAIDSPHGGRRRSG